MAEKKEYEVITEGYVTVEAESEEEARALAERKVNEVTAPLSSIEFFLQVGSEVTCLTDMDDKADSDDD